MWVEMKMEFGIGAHLASAHARRSSLQLRTNEDIGASRLKYRIPSEVLYCLQFSYQTFSPSSDLPEHRSGAQHNGP